MGNKSIQVQDWGVIEYGEALTKQRGRLADLIAGQAEDTIVLCQHPAVITCGTSTQDNSLLSTPEMLLEEQIGYFNVERGGDITYHGPGQLVAYPLINLHHFKTDIGWYMRSLEQAIIETLNALGVTSTRYEGRTGVWVSPTAKIASMGVKLSRWCSMHGVALNISKESTQGFDHIVPCGLAGVRATSIEHEVGVAPGFALVKTLLAEKIIANLNILRE